MLMSNGTHFTRPLVAHVIRRPRSGDAELPLEEVKRGKTDADGHWSLDPVHAQTLKHPSRTLLLE